MGTARLRATLSSRRGGKNTRDNSFVSWHADGTCAMSTEAAVKMKQGPSYCAAVFRSGARTSRIVAVEADLVGTVRLYGTYCRYRPPTSMYLPGTEASDVTPGGCKDADVVPVPELVVVNWSKCEAAGLWV